MAKVTEQDLIDMDFSVVGNSVDGLWFEKIYDNIVIGKTYIFTSTDNRQIFVGFKNENDLAMNHIAMLPLTTANLDLFIRFAEGKEL